MNQNEEIEFKENGPEKYYKDDNGNWVKCDEEKIESLWEVWVSSENAKKQYVDKEGFTVFEFKSSNKPLKLVTKDLYNDDWINLDGNLIHRTAIIHPNVKLGKGNIIGAYCVIGGNGEMRNVSQNDFQGHVVIGDDNVISEVVTIQRPFNKGQTTKIGSRNIIMAHCHIGHDAKIYDDTEICTGTIIGGYCQVHFRAKIKLKCVVRNRIVIASDAIVGMGSVVTKNVEQKQVVYGNPAKPKI